MSAALVASASLLASGALLAGSALALAAWVSRKSLFALLLRALRPLVRAIVRRRLGGFRHLHHAPDPSRPLRPAGPRRVAVIGAGLGGIAASAHLGERGFEVTLIDASPHLGGKIAGWQERAPDGALIEMEHGFHAFFRHYENLGRFLARIGAPAMTPIDDYLVMARSGERWSFGKSETTPVLNLLSLAGQGVYRLSELARSPEIERMNALLAYDPARTFAELDHVSLERFADELGLPQGLRTVFTAFGRAFFAEPSRMSMAELVKSFHFYYLSHDHGLLYDHPTSSYRTAVIEPMRRHLEAHGVVLQLGRRVGAIGREDARLSLDGERYDHVVLATDVVGARRIAEASPALGAPGTRAALSALRPSEGYAVLRVWLDRDVRTDLPVFVAIERRRLLDAVALYHRITPDARAWAERHGGAVLELHCYALPDGIDDEDAIAGGMLEELEAAFEELAGCSVVHRSLQVRRDFPAFHVGMAAGRPGVETELDNLHLAADWVKLPFPAMLMEAAFSAGLLAANAICRAEGVRTFEVWSVPPRGLLAKRAADFARA